jgi:phage shock protein A
MATFDSVVSQIENHDAIVSAAIRDLELRTRTAEAQLSRVRRDGAALREKIASTDNEAARWRTRASRTAAVDESKALECLKRALREEKQVALLKTQEQEHAKVERQLTEGVQELRERIRLLKQQRNILRTRQSRADAQHLVQQIDDGSLGDLDSVLDRWEERLLISDPLILAAPEEERLCDEFSSAEEQEELRKELARIVAGHDSLTKE